MSYSIEQKFKLIINSLKSDCITPSTKNILNRLKELGLYDINTYID